eukprot:COSAG03_NODE_24848_length_269_cov_0.911765_1_plen_58_part_10
MSSVCVCVSVCVGRHRGVPLPYRTPRSIALDAALGKSVDLDAGAQLGEPGALARDSER